MNYDIHNCYYFKKEKTDLREILSVNTQLWELVALSQTRDAPSHLLNLLYILDHAAKCSL